MSRRATRWVAIGCVAASVLLLRGPLFEPSFGVVDDGYRMELVRRVVDAEGWDASWEAFRGNLRARFWPVFMIWHLGLYAAFGPSPLPYFLAQAALLAMSLWLVFRLGSVLSPARPLASGLWAALLFLTSGPVAENYVTLGKQNPLLTLLLLGLVSCLVRASAAEGRGDSGARPLACAVLLGCLAVGTKETAVAMAPALLVGAWLCRRSGSVPWRPAAVLGAAVGAASGLSRLLVPVSAGINSYTKQYAQDLAGLGERLPGHMASYGLLLAPTMLAAPLVLWLFLRRPADSRDPRMLLVAVSAAALAAVFLPWRFVFLRYMLPACALWAVFAGPVLAARAGGRLRTAAVALALAGALHGAASHMVESDARGDYDAVSAELLDFLDSVVERGERVYIVGTTRQEEPEQLSHLARLVHGRPDLVLRPMMEESALPILPVSALPGAAEEDLDGAFLRRGGWVVVPLQGNLDHLPGFYYPPQLGLTDQPGRLVRGLLGVTLGRRALLTRSAAVLVPTVPVPLCLRPATARVGYEILRFEPLGAWKADLGDLDGQFLQQKGGWRLAGDSALIVVCLTPGAESQAREIRYRVTGEGRLRAAANDSSLPASRSKGARHTILLPPGALRPGRNEILLRASTGEPPLLTELVIGPRTAGGQ